MIHRIPHWLIPALCVLALLAAPATQALAAGHRLVMQTKLSGKAGEVVTCLSSDNPPEYTITFPKEDAKLTITVEWVDKNPPVERFNNDGHTLPMLSGKIKKLTVEFRSEGSCQVAVHVRE